MIYGFCGVVGKGVEAVRAEDDWWSIQAAKRNGSAFVLSCSDRFSFPPEYYFVEVESPEQLPERLERERTKAMTAVLAVWDLASATVAEPESPHD